MMTMMVKMIIVSSHLYEDDDHDGKDDFEDDYNCLPPMIMMIWGWLYFPLTCMTQPAILNPWSKQTCNQRLQTKEKIWHSVDNWLMKRRMKSHLHEPAKSGGVVVPDGLRIAKRLEDRVCLKDLLLHPRWDVCCHAGGCSFGDGSYLFHILYYP